jgi:menaquinone-specific isochorismate synthase
MSANLSKCIDLLRSEIETAFSTYVSVKDSRLYSLSVNLHLDQVPAIPQLTAPFLIWGRPDRNHYRIGLGTTLQYKTSGKERFLKLQCYFDKIRSNWHHDCLTELPYQPGAFCAFAFDEDDTMSGPWKEIANTMITIPELLLEFSEGRYTLTLSCQTSQLQTREKLIKHWLTQATILLQSVTTKDNFVESKNTLYRTQGGPTNYDWMISVENAKTAIDDNQLAKVVAARHVHIQGTHAFNETAILKRLAKNYPSCYLLGISLGSKTLVAATPEQLIAINNGTISCDALGGTGKRGDDTRQDNLFAHRLLQDTKTRHEHQLVVDHLHQRLSDISAHLSIPDNPTVLSLGQMQHLWTPIKAQCRPGISLFELAASLHPTPAVAGTPVEEAKQWIEQNEPFNRGWYSGGVGWIQADGNGELAVLLRAALLSDNNAELYAGAGIVADSDPRAELDETELKLRSIFDMLCKKDVDNEAHQTA